MTLNYTHNSAFIVVNSRYEYEQVVYVIYSMMALMFLIKSITPEFTETYRQ